MWWDMLGLCAIVGLLTGVVLLATRSTAGRHGDRLPHARHTAAHPPSLDPYEVPR